METKKYTTRAYTTGLESGAWLTVSLRRARICEASTTPFADRVNERKEQELKKVSYRLIAYNGGHTPLSFDIS